MQFIERAHKAGVESFWYKDAGKEELLEVMDRTMKGESVYPDAPPTVMIGMAKVVIYTGGTGCPAISGGRRILQKNCREFVHITGDGKMAY